MSTDLSSMIEKTHKKHRLIIIGAGMAGTRFAFKLAQTSDAFDITLINAEAHAGYNRIMLSPVLAGEKSFEDIALYPQADYQTYNINLKTNCNVKSIETKNKQIHTSTDECLAYDKLVFATGSNPFILPLENHDASGVHAFRTIADVNAMLKEIKIQKDKAKASRCVIIGAGLLGLEAANALNNHGADVTVVHTGDYLLNRQLDENAASLLQKHFERKGIRFLLQAHSQIIEVNDKNEVCGLTFNNDSRIQADSIIMTVGVRPNQTLAKESGIDCEKGILVDAYMQTNTPDVYAIGECVEFEQHLFGLVAPVYEQADILVQTLLGMPKKFRVKSTATKLKVSGVNLFSAGDIDLQKGQQTLVYEDLKQSIYKKLILENNQLKGAVLYGDVADGAWFFELIQNKTDITAIRQYLLFGQAFCADELNEISTEVRA